MLGGSSSMRDDMEATQATGERESTFERQASTMDTTTASMLVIEINALRSIVNEEVRHNLVASLLTLHHTLSPPRSPNDT